MRSVSAVALVPVLAVGGCTLLVDTSGYSSGAAPDAGADAPSLTDAEGPGPDGAAADAGADAPVDAPPDAADDSLVARWTFDEDGGTTVHDTSGHGHDGALTGGTWTTGRIGGALGFNGTTDVLTVPASTDFDRPAGASFTMAAWVKRSGAVSHSFVTSYNYSASAAYAIELQSDTLMNYWDGASHVAASTIALGAGEWHHVAVTVTSGVTAVLYFDGARIGAAAADGTARTCTGVMFGTSPYGDHLPAALDDVRYYRRALSDADVAALASP